MPKTTKSTLTENDEMNNTDIKKYHRDDDRSDPDARAHELRLWPPPRLQAYCLDHFLMECEIYHEQENDRYNKLVAYSRETFLEKQNQKKPSSQPIPVPTRLQPSRRAKERHLVVGATPPMTLRGPPRPVRLPGAPFKPAKLEKTFRTSQQGAMFRILTELYEKLELQRSWEEYRSSLENRIQETANRLQAEAERDRNINCVFRGPLGIECRYCGFVDMVRDDEAVTPRKLAPPAAMRAIKHLCEGSEGEGSGLTFRGIDLVIDVCGEQTMIVLVNLKGVLDLCAEIFEEEEVMPDSPTSLFAALKRRSDEPRSGRGHKRKSGVE
ncbi:hypothetical protein F4823DRAFT_633421 [Ustulina deusta]|nr:hypothetical protein F4823DRAFT_633421 [Ustulina deusta]